MASKSIGDLAVKITADTTKFAAGLDKAKRETDTFGTKLKQGFATAAKGATILAAGFTAIALTANKVSEAAQIAVTYLDNIGKTARRLGLTTDQLQELRIQADASGISVGVLDTAFQRFARRTGEGTLNKLFDALNIDLKDAQGNMRQNIDLWNEFGNKVAQLEDGNEQLAVAMRAVDTEGVKVVEMWRQTAEEKEAVIAKMREYGLVFDSQVIAKAEVYKTEIDLVKKAQDALWTNSDAGMAAMALDWEKLKLKIYASSVELARFLGLYGVQHGTIEKQAEDAIQAHQQLQQQKTYLDQKYAAAQTDEARAAIKRNQDTNAKMLADTEQNMAALLKQLELAESLKSGATKDGKPVSTVKGTGVLADGAAAGIKKSANEMANFAKQLKQAHDPAIKLREEIEKINQAEAAGAISSEVAEYSRQQRYAAMLDLLEDAQTETKKLAEEQEKLNDLGSEMGMTFASAFEEAIMKAEDFGDVLQGLAEDILRIMIRTQVTEPLAQGLSGIFSSGLSGLFGGGGGSVSSSIDMSAFDVGDAMSLSLGAAGGGRIYPGQIRPVGERGPELFVPDGPGTIMPNYMLGGGGNGGGNVNIEIINQGTAQTVTGQSQSQDAAGMVIQLMLDDLQSGGKISQGYTRAFGLRRGGG